jgi:uncharacterized small protein (DUF1192 family)
MAGIGLSGGAAMIQHIDVSLVRQDGGTQARAAMAQEAIDEYALAMSEGKEFPSITVFFDGKVYWLGDGFHRVAAHTKTFGIAPIRAEVQDGSQRDALLFAAGANSDHGLRRTNADKRRAVSVLLNDAEWSQWSDREIARRVGVSNDFVSRMRKDQVSLNDTPRDGMRKDQVSLNDTLESNNHIPGHGDPEPAHSLPEDGRDVETGVDSDSSQNPRLGNASEEEHKQHIRALRDAAESQARIQELTAEVANLKEHLAEMADSLRAATEDNESMERIILADDRLTALMDEVKRFKEQARVSMARVRGITSELNDAKHYARLWKKKFDALEKKVKGKADDTPDGEAS